MKTATWRHNIVTFALLVVPSAAALAAIYATPWEMKTKVFSSVLSAVVFAFSTAMSRVDAAFLSWQRLSRLLFNPTTAWRFCARLRIDESTEPSDALKRIIETLSNSKVARAHVFSREESRALLQFGAIVFDVRVREELSGGCWLVIEIRDAQTPYRHTRRVFEEVVSCLIEDACEQIKPSEQKYELEFRFPEDTNPFLGPMVRRIVPAGDFDWKYRTETPRKGTLTITRNKLVVVTPSPAELQIYFAKLVGLSIQPTPAQ